MARALLYEQAEFEPLIDEPWVAARVEDAIAEIVADADAAFDPDALWPAHEWEGWEEPLPLKSLYVGVAGVIWALDALRRTGHGATRTPRRRRALAAGRRLPRPRDLARHRRKHTRAAPTRTGRCPRDPNRSRSRRARLPQRWPGQLAGNAASDARAAAR